MFIGLSQQSTTSWVDSNHVTLLLTVMETGSPGARGWHLPKQGQGAGSAAWFTLCFQLLTVSGIPTSVGPSLPCLISSPRVCLSLSLCMVFLKTMCAGLFVQVFPFFLRISTQSLTVKAMFPNKGRL